MLTFSLVPQAALAQVLRLERLVLLLELGVCSMLVVFGHSEVWKEQQEEKEYLEVPVFVYTG